MSETRSNLDQLERDVTNAARQYRHAYDAMLEVIQDVVKRAKDRRPMPLGVRGGEGTARAHLDDVFATLDTSEKATYDRAAAAADEFDAAHDRWKQAQEVS